MSDKPLFHLRAFLNDESGSAMVEADFHESTWINKQTGERRFSASGTIHVTDCSRSIELDVCFDDLDGARRVLRKLDRLLDAVNGVRDAAARIARREFGRKV
jgi:hypothetical protein